MEDDDPRIALRGHKKVVATGRIRKNQILGIYEGEVLFEMELVCVWAFRLTPINKHERLAQPSYMAVPPNVDFLINEESINGNALLFI